MRMIKSDLNHPNVKKILINKISVGKVLCNSGETQTHEHIHVLMGIYGLKCRCSSCFIAKSDNIYLQLRVPKEGINHNITYPSIYLILLKVMILYWIKMVYRFIYSYIEKNRYGEFDKQR